MMGLFKRFFGKVEIEPSLQALCLKHLPEDAFGGSDADFIQVAIALDGYVRYIRELSNIELIDYLMTDHGLPIENADAFVDASRPHRERYRKDLCMPV
jgi:hypothetical protein